MKHILLLSVCLALFTAGIAQTRTKGTLTFKFTQAKPTGYSSEVLGVWLEDSLGAFLETKMRYYGGGTSDHLPAWTSNSSNNLLDAMTGATLKSTSTVKPFTTYSFVWDGKSIPDSTASIGGGIAKDGLIHVKIESAWNPGTAYGTDNVLDTYDFEKGTKPVHLSLTGDAYFNTITIDWVPLSTGVETVVGYSQDINVFPNPTSGIINVQYTNAIGISIVSIDGSLIYKTKVEGNLPGTTQIDISPFAKGVYYVLVDDGILVNKLKVILTH